MGTRHCSIEYDRLSGGFELGGFDPFSGHVYAIYARQCTALECYEWFCALRETHDDNYVLTHLDDAAFEALDKEPVTYYDLYPF